MNALTEIKAASAPCDDVKWHPYSELFPWIEGAAFEDLKADIAANGIREPIVFFEDQVLDGRNRYKAARDLGIAYPRIEYEGDDPLSFVVSLNLKRRHLSESQRALVAKRLANMPEGRPSNTPAIEGVSISQSRAANMLNVSVASVERASVLIDRGAPELIAAVDAGTASVSAASEVAKLPVEEQVSTVKAGPAAIKEVAKVVRESGAEPETIALREAVIEAARQGLAPQRRNFRNPDKVDDPAYDMLARILGPSRAMVEQVERGEINVALALQGFIDADQRERALRRITHCRDFLTSFLETANAH